MKRQILDLAFSLDQAAFSAQAIQQISSYRLIGLSDAYTIQKASLDNRYGRGEKLVGYKLGFTSRAKMEQMGVHDLIWGRLTDQMHIANGGTLNRTDFIHPRVEPEIAFLIGKRIERKIRLQEAASFLKGVAGALEVIDSRYENFKFSLEDVIADNCSSAAFVIGDWLSPDVSVKDLSIEVYINEEKSQTGNSNAILGNPMESLVEISRILSEQDIALEVGTVVLAGAATSAVHIHTGDKIEGQFGQLGTVRLNVK